jgi:hypothetical protein
MQEQLPLRPAEFVKIRDGFIAFLKQPAGTPIEQVIPQEVLDAMASAARRGRNRHPARRVLRREACSYGETATQCLRDRHDVRRRIFEPLMRKEPASAAHSALNLVMDGGELHCRV